jgi:hypothetical protein
MEVRGLRVRWEDERNIIRVVIYSGSVEDAEIRSLEIRCGGVVYSIEWNGEDRVTLQTRRNGVWQGKVSVESHVTPWFVKHSELSKRVEKDGVERTARDIIDFFIQLVNGIVNGTLQPARASQ